MLVAFVQQEYVVLAGRSCHLDATDSVAQLLEFVVPRTEPHRNRARAGSPDVETHASVRKRERTEPMTAVSAHRGGRYPRPDRVNPWIRCRARWVCRADNDARPSLYVQAPAASAL